MSTDLRPAVRYATTPPSATTPARTTRRRGVRQRLLGGWHPTRRQLLQLATLGAALALTAPLVLGTGAPDLAPQGRTTLVVFALAVWAWVATRLDDTYVALGAATALVLTDVLSTDELFATLGDQTVWLLLGAFVIASAVTSSGLAGRAAASVVVAARTPRQLVHLTTGALVVTAFAVPSTSGRAALALPVFTSLAAALAGREALVRALALLVPTVVLLSAVASLLGAGAHLVTSQVLETATGTGIDFGRWLLLGLPLAVVSSHVAAEVVLRGWTTREERRTPVRLTAAGLDRGGLRATGPLTTPEVRAAQLLAAVVVLWCTGPLHGVDPAVVALLGALVATSPRWGSVTLATSLKAAPWSLLLFLAATLALGTALTSSGAAQWLAGGAFARLAGASSFAFLAGVVVLSTAAHLVVQSRSARSSVLVPVVVALSPAAGVDPAAAAFASTAAAGFCHTLPSSAKPVALFSDVEGAPTYAPRDLLRLSAVLAPLHVVLVLVFAYAVWPLLGLSP